MLKVDDREVARRRMPHTIPFVMPIDETFDVGVDTRTPVDHRDYKIPFRFNGKLSKVTFSPIALAARPPPISRGFFPWRFSDAGPTGCSTVASGRHPKSFTKNGRYLGLCVRAFQLVCSTPMNGLETTLAPFEI